MREEVHMEEAIRLAAGQGHMEVHPEDLSFPEGGIELFLKMLITIL